MLYHGIDNTKVPGGAGFNAGLGYELQLNERFLFLAGAEFHRFGSLTRLNGYGENYTYIYDDGRNIVPLDYRFNFLEYSNRHRVAYVNFPVMFGMQFERYYAMLGSKIGLNLTGQYTTDALIQAVVTDPTAIEPWVDIYAPAPFSQAGNLNLGLNATVSAEFGVILDEWLPAGMLSFGNRRPISYRAGVFVDYGLLNVNCPLTNNTLLIPQDHVVLGNTPQLPPFGMSDLSSSYLAQDKRFGNLYAGIKLTVLFQVSRERRPGRPAPQPIMFYAQVVDAATYNPLDAEVTVRAANRQVFRQRTDADGFVSHEMRSGRYNVSAQAEGYTAFRQSVTHNKLDTLVIALQAVPIFHIRVIDAETGENLKAEVTVNATTANNPLVFKQDTDASSGMLTYSTLRPGRYQLNVIADGYIYHSELFDFSKTETKTVALQPIKEGVTVVLENLFFEFARAEIMPASEPTLEELYQFLSQNPSIQIHIVGHTDNVGTLAYNMTLSTNRAKAVYDAIVRKGIDPARLTFEGRGPNEPVETNDTEEGRAKNRRVEFIIK